jgi:hypothetical protein
MRPLAFAVGTWAATWGCSPQPAGTRIASGVGAVSDRVSARELDRQGVRSFREGRFADAIRYFRAALEHGGPSSELWNVARCEERRGDPQAADFALEEYLARGDLSGPDRVDARREAEALRARPSMLTVVTEPAGASVWIDGDRTAGTTPLSVEVPPGVHAVTVRRAGYGDAAGRAEARFGRAVVVSLDLSRIEK